MELSDNDKALIRDCLDRGEPLPDRFRWLLFAEPREAELIWPGKTTEVTNVVLPFQCIEQIDEPRAEAELGAMGTGDLFSVGAGGRQSGGWSNKLIWGDNKLVLASLKGGPLRREIEAAGGLKLVYIDPPFDVGADFSFDVEVGGEQFTKSATVIEEIAYRDTWGRGADSYASMIYERLSIICALLNESATIYVHCDSRVNALIRFILDELLGTDHCINQITWRRTGSHNDPGRYGIISDTIFFYRKGTDYIWNQPYGERSREAIDTSFAYAQSPAGEIVRLSKGQEPEPGWRRFQSVTLRSPNPRPNLTYDYRGFRPHRNGWSVSPERMKDYDSRGLLIFPESLDGAIRLKMFLDESPGIPIQDIWTDINKVEAISNENLDYATQKPEALLSRIVSTSSNPGDLIADFFCGSGTTIAVAEKLGRKWIGADLGRFAIHTSRKRLIGVQRQLKAEGRPYRSFEILNLGKYERQWFAGIDPTLPEPERTRVSIAREAKYLALILQAYQAQPLEQSPPFHGSKAGALVLVGPVDAPVTEQVVAEAVTAARAMNAGRVDVLGFEFEMGLAPRMVDEAKAKGVQVALRYIPKDVFDTRAVKAGQVAFYDVAYVEARATVADKKQRIVTVSLTDFGVAYRQDERAELVAALKPGGSKVTVLDGQVVKIAKAKSGEVTQEVLTKQWTDWIDYWAVDFDYASKPETIFETVIRPDGTSHHVPQWTGRYIFENEWQSFRTRKSRALELTSAPHTYATPGRKAVAVKVIDIFGNDTTKVIGVEV